VLRINCPRPKSADFPHSRRCSWLAGKILHLAGLEGKPQPMAGSRCRAQEFVIDRNRGAGI